MKNSLLSLALSFALTTPLCAQWNSDPMLNLGIAIKPGDEVQPKVRPTANGGCFVSWMIAGNSIRT